MKARARKIKWFQDAEKIAISPPDSPTASPVLCSGSFVREGNLDAMICKATGHGSRVLKSMST